MKIENNIKDNEKRNFFRQAVLNSINILEPTYWNNTKYQKEGVTTVIAFAKLLTEETFNTNI